MPLDTTPGSATATAYADRARAAVSAAYRAGGAAFLELDGFLQDEALEESANAIDAALSGPCNQPTTATQSRLFPVNGSTEVREDIIEASIVLAFALVPKYALASNAVLVAPTDARRIKRVESGDDAVEWFDDGLSASERFSRFPENVRDRLWRYVCRTTAPAWGVGDATRTSF